MNRETFQKIIQEALTEVLDELGYPQSGRSGRLCGISTDPPPQDRDELEFCAEYADRREGYYRICIPRTATEADAKAEVKRRLTEHGVVPGVGYVRPSD
jgi:hypothetical protein